MAITKPRNSEECEPQRGRGRPQVRCDEETRAVITDAARQHSPAPALPARAWTASRARAGVSTKTLYRLFPNKQALFEGMVTERIETLRLAL